MRLSPDGGVTPAPRREGDMAAARAAYESGIVFRGDVDIPIIDWRHYLEAELDMHHSHQSFATRQRMLNFDGRASNQVVWFTDARPARTSDQTPLALEVIDEWEANIRAKPWRGVVRNKPDRTVDSCFATKGLLMHAGRATRGTGSSIRVPTGRARSCSRCMGRPGSSRAGRSRAASSSARRNPSRPRSSEGSTARGTRLRPSRPGWSRSSRAESATTPSGTRVCRRSFARAPEQGNGRPPRAAARVPPIVQLLRNR
jgi:hypothetical protein